jgi:ceramide glucosyltransferase
MRADLRGIAEKLALCTALVGVAYAVTAIVRVRAFGRRLRETPPEPARRPAVTLIKPVRGIEPGLEESLRSFCVQDYPAYEVVFGVHDGEDPALDVIRRVAAAAPDRTTVVVGDGVARFRNPKMTNVAPMLAHAHGEIIVISDSDMRVRPDYLDAVAAPFADPRVGAVTALYRGEPADGTLASVLGAMCLTEQFAPSTLVANAIEPVRYIFGSTMAIRRDVLSEIGGIEALGDHLADDFALGRLVTEKGYLVAVARCVVANVVAERDLRSLFEHELRWARTIRAVRPLNYPGIALTYPLPLALVHLVLARDKRTALVVAALAGLLRLTIHDAAHAAFGSQKRPPRRLIPLRDALGVIVWARGLWGRSVRWQGQRLHIAERDRIAHRTETAEGSSEH